MKTLETLILEKRGLVEGEASWINISSFCSQVMYELNQISNYNERHNAFVNQQPLSVNISTQYGNVEVELLLNNHELHGVITDFSYPYYLDLKNVPQNILPNWLDKENRIYFNLDIPNGFGGCVLPYDNEYDQSTDTIKNLKIIFSVIQLEKDQPKILPIELGPFGHEFSHCYDIYLNKKYKNQNNNKNIIDTSTDFYNDISIINHISSIYWSSEFSNIVYDMDDFCLLNPINWKILNWESLHNFLATYLYLSNETEIRAHFRGFVDAFLAAYSKQIDTNDPNKKIKLSLKTIELAIPILIFLKHCLELKAKFSSKTLIILSVQMLPYLYEFFKILDKNKFLQKYFHKKFNYKNPIDRMNNLINEIVIKLQNIIKPYFRFINGFLKEHPNVTIVDLDKWEKLLNK